MGWEKPARFDTSFESTRQPAAIANTCEMVERFSTRRWKEDAGEAGDGDAGDAAGGGELSDSDKGAGDESRCSGSKNSVARLSTSSAPSPEEASSADVDEGDALLAIGN